MDRNALEILGRDELLAEARRFGVRRPEVMTRVELVDEVLRLSTPNPVERKKVRGWLGVARDLVASAVERGLNLPDAAAFIRGDVRYEPLRAPQPPVATVTLAEIYGAQGHIDRAVGMLDEVLSKESDHQMARKLRDRLDSERERKRFSDRPRANEPVTEDEPPTDDDPDGSVPTLMPPEEPEAVTIPPEEPEPITVPPEEREPITARNAGSKTEPEEPEPITARPLAVKAENEEPAAVFARTTAASASVYFELGASGDGEPVVVRVVEVRPRPTGAERVEHEVSVQGQSGTVTIQDLQAGSVLRAAVGRKRSGAFRALAVAAELNFTADGLAVAWAPRAGVDYHSVAARSSLQVSRP